MNEPYFRELEDFLENRRFIDELPTEAIDRMIFDLLVLRDRKFDTTTPTLSKKLRQAIAALQRGKVGVALEIYEEETRRVFGPLDELLEAERKRLEEEENGDEEDGTK